MGISKKSQEINGQTRLIFTDENGVRQTSWTYDCYGRATSSQQADGAEKVSIVYGDPDTNGVSVNTVTHTLGTSGTPVTTVRNYQYSKINGVRLD